MAEIQQRLGFEASQAIQTLNQLQAALSGVNRQLRALNTAANQRSPAVVQGFAQTAQAAKQAQQSVAAAGNAMQTTGQQGAKAGQSITLSWQTMLRIVTTQVIIRSLNGLINLFAESTRAAHDFQIEVARISTIARGPGSSISELTKSLNDLSVQLGRPISEVTAAAFEALQNDLGSTTETMNLLSGAAHELALITGGDLTQAVNAISSVLKSYNLDVSQANDVSDIFFTTIDVGRVKLADLSDSLGTITPLAAQLGVDFANVGASIAAITQSGTNAATATTQLRNVLQKLIKPTEALDAAFRQLGVSSGQELIRTSGGLVPALQRLSDVVNGDERALAQMFGTIRGQLGVFNLLANNSKVVNIALSEMANRAGRAKEALQTIEQTDARALDRGIQELNLALRNLGNETLKIQLAFVKLTTEAVQGFGTLTSTVTGLVDKVNELLNPSGNNLLTTVSALTSAFALLGLGIASTLEEITGLNVGASSALQALIKASTQAIVEGRKIAIEQVKKASEAAEKDITQRLREEVTARNGVMGDYLSKVTTIYNQEVVAFNKRSQELIAIQSNVVSNFETAAKSISSQIDAFFAGAADRLQERANATKTAFQELADFKFDRSIAGQDDRSKAFALDEEAARRTRAALEELRKADASGSEEARKAALEQVNAAKAFNERAKAAAEAAQLQGKATSALDRQQELLEAAAKSAKNLEDAERHAQQQITQLDSATTKARLANLDALIKKHAELIEEQNRSGTAPDRAKEIDTELAKNARQFAEQFAQLTQDNLLKTLKLDQVFKQAALEAASALDNVRSQWNGARESLQAALDRGPFKAVAEVVDQATAGTGNKVVDRAVEDTTKSFSDIQNPAEQAQKLLDAVAKVKQEAQLAEAKFRAQELILGKNNSAVDLFLSKLQDVDGAAKGSVSSLTAMNEAIGGASAEQLALLTTELERIQQQIQTQTQAGILTGEQTKALQEAVIALFDNIDARRQQLEAEGFFGNGVVEAADQVLTQITERIGALDLGIPPEKVAAMFEPLSTGAATASQQMTQQFQQTTTALSSGFTQASNTAKTAIAGIQPIISSISTAGAIAQMNALAAAAQRALTLALQAASVSAGGGQHFGGAIHRAQGGQVTRGVDTRIVAMQPGEFVVNKKSSGKFFSQLQAINGGQAPSFREEGGSVTNIGDINVSVNAPNGQEVSGRDIAIALRREIRRETSKLF